MSGLRRAALGRGKCRMGHLTAVNCRAMSSSPLITHERVGEVALLRMDDKKMNAFSKTMIAEVHQALDAAEGAGAIVLTGNQKCLSAGFCLKTMGTYPSPQAADLLNDGGKLLLRLLALPQPLVIAVPGHGARDAAAFHASLHLYLSLSLSPPPPCVFAE